MKKIISLVLLSILIIGMTGCASKSKNKSIDINLKKGDITSICKNIDNSDDIKISSVTTTNYNKDHYAINMKIKAIYKYSDKESFKFYVDETKNTAETYNKMKDTIYKYSIDTNKMEITTILGYQKLEVTDENKDIYHLDKIVGDAEAKGDTCSLIGITRADAGLSK